jgi:hypothetical protein
MKLLLDGSSFARRIAVADDSLRPLADSLAADLEPLLHRDIYFPREKALLSRTGGRCADDGELLTFDPFSPHEHRCPRCGRTYTGDFHDRFWIYWYQLWLAERAVHAALLSSLRGGERFSRLAASILRGYAERYLTYPNVDNVLGPTRLFFSTYLESIWLLQICIAADLLSARERDLVETVRDRIVEPSRALIAEYDEGASNRQVWNDAALLAAARLLDDDRAADQAVHGVSGVSYHLRNGLLVDGSWYEGEYYHLFAHRGLWYGVAMAERAGIPLDATDVDRFQVGFSTPFLTALPDLTLPSRRDSQYAISLRQWRIAEHCELGLARRDDDSLRAALARLYTADIPHRETGRATSAADVERNAPPSALTRADLSWRALLFARAELPELAGAEPVSALLEGQGIAISRRDSGRVYVALDYGHSGGGHGHPDRLNLLLVDGETRWLDDYGTGSYTDRSLHWYRSTLAHNAPFVDGRSQRPTDGLLLAYEEQGDLGWIKAKAEIAPGVEAVRTIVVTSGYLIDTLEWVSRREVGVDLPVHADLALERGATAVEKPLTGGDGTEDGFAFLHDSYVQLAAAGERVSARARQGNQSLEVWAECSTACEWWRTVAPGPPGRDERAFRVLRARAPQGEHRIVWDWSGTIRDVSFDDLIRVSLADGTMHEHSDAIDHWRVTARRGDEHRVAELRGLRRKPTEQTETIEHRRNPDAEFRLSYGVELTRDLARDAYRRSESTWEECGSPRAIVGLQYDEAGLGLHIHVSCGERTFVPAGAVNPYDNEPADINGDSVQLYLRFGDETCGWMLVPEADPIVRVRPIDGWRCARPIEAHWAPKAGGGYSMFVRVANDLPDAVDVIVNEKPIGRERRRGQLVLSGAHGEFVYLRGDRHDAKRLIPIRYAR